MFWICCDSSQGFFSHFFNSYIFVFALPLKWKQQFLSLFLTVQHHIIDACFKVGQLPVTMNKDINAMWQSPRRAAKAGCLPSANMNSEGTRKQVPALHNQFLPPGSISSFTHIPPHRVFSLLTGWSGDWGALMIAEDLNPYVLWRSQCMAVSLYFICCPFSCSWQTELLKTSSF